MADMLRYNRPGSDMHFSLYSLYGRDIPNTLDFWGPSGEISSDYPRDSRKFLNFKTIEVAVLKPTEVGLIDTRNSKELSYRKTMASGLRASL